MWCKANYYRRVAAFVAGSSVALLAGSVIWASAASANTVSIGAGVNNGPITNFGSQENSLSFTFSNFNGWSSNIVTGVAPVQGSFNSTNLNQIVSTDPPTNNILDVYVTASNLGFPNGNNIPLTSNFTVSALPSGWTVNEMTFLNADNALFGKETLLADPGTFFSAAGTRGPFNSTENLTGPYSLTELFMISSGGLGSGTANTSIQISTPGGFSPVPIPGALPLFASGLVGLWGWTRRRKKTTAKLAA